MNDGEKKTRRARWIRLAGPTFGVAACTAAITGTSIDAWTTESRVMRSAARYMPRTAGMVSGAVAARADGTKAPPASAPAPAASEAGATTATATTAAAPPVMRDRRGRPLSVWDMPMSAAWPAEHEWTPAVEEDYGRFVTAIGRGLVARRCIRLDDCLNNPSINPLYSPDEARLGLMPDCADLPYLLRGYFAFKRHLPFGFVAAMGGGEHGDPRYLHQGIPVLWRQWTDFRSPRAFFDEVVSYVHSGMFRLSPKLEDGDTYAPRIDRASVRPGTMYYDTNGHVLVVAEVEPDGAVQFIDGHPGGYISHPHFETPRQSPAGSANWGGGFRNWRPQRLVNGAIVRARNAQIADFAPLHQYNRSNYVVAGAPVEYDDWVRHSLRAPGFEPQPPATNALQAMR